MAAGCARTPTSLGGARAATVGAISMRRSAPRRPPLKTVLRKYASCGQPFSTPGLPSGRRPRRAHTEATSRRDLPADACRALKYLAGSEIGAECSPRIHSRREGTEAGRRGESACTMSEAERLRARRVRGVFGREANVQRMRPAGELSASTRTTTAGRAPMAIPSAIGWRSAPLELSAPGAPTQSRRSRSTVRRGEPGRGARSAGGDPGAGAAGHRSAARSRLSSEALSAAVSPPARPWRSRSSAACAQPLPWRSTTSRSRSPGRRRRTTSWARPWG